MAGIDGTLELKLEDGKRTVSQSASPYANYAKKQRHDPPFQDAVVWDKNYAYPFSGMSVFGTDTTVTLPNSPIKDTPIPTINGGEITILSGKNGTGKTKLMEEMVKKGSLFLRKEKGLQIAYLPQFWPEEVTQGSVKDFFLWVKDGVNPHSEKTVERFRKRLGELGFKKDAGSFLTLPLRSFSGGEQRLMWFAAVSIFEGTDLLVLDEPTNHMDASSMLLVSEMIKNFPGGSVLSTHDLRLMGELHGKGEQNRAGTVNLIFERDKDTPTKIRETKESPLHYAKSVIDKARGSARRIQL